MPYYVTSKVGIIRVFQEKPTHSARFKAEMYESLELATVQYRQKIRGRIKEKKEVLAKLRQMDPRRKTIKKELKKLGVLLTMSKPILV